MTKEFAATAAVVVPVILLAAGAAAREFEKATRTSRMRPSAQRVRALQVLEYLQRLPDLEKSKENVRDRRIRALVDLAEILNTPPSKAETRAEGKAFAQALIGLLWIGALVVLGVVQVLTLQWLAEEHPSPDSGLVYTSLCGIAFGLLMLLVTPMAYLWWSSWRRELPPIPTYFSIWREARRAKVRIFSPTRTRGRNATPSDEDEAPGED